MMRAIVLIESMTGNAVPSNLTKFRVKEYSHYLGLEVPSKIARLEFGSGDLPEVAFHLMLELRPHGFYSHINTGSDLLVIFPRAIVSISRGNDLDVERAIQVGEGFGVKRIHMSFRSMFEIDHPEMHGGNDEWGEE
jgi:hypothetical protein